MILKNNKMIFSIQEQSELSTKLFNDHANEFIFIKKDISSELKKAKILSRLCLSLALEQEHKLIEPQKIEIINNHYIVNFPGTLESLSHTKSASAGVIASQDDYFSIGVDIESLNRPIKSGIEKFFINEEDTKELSHLELWCLKEACFKALHPVYKRLNLKRTLTLKDIVIHSEHNASVKCIDQSTQTINTHLQQVTLSQSYLLADAVIELDRNIA